MNASFLSSLGVIVPLPKKNGKAESTGGQRGRTMSPEKVNFFAELAKMNVFTWENLTKSKDGQLAVTLPLSEVPGLPEQAENQSDFDYYSEINVYIANLVNSFIKKHFDEAYWDQLAPNKPIKGALAFDSTVEAVNDADGFPIMRGNCQVFRRVPTDHIPQLSSENMADFVNRLEKNYGRQRVISDTSESTGWITQPNRMVFVPGHNDYRVIFGIRLSQ